MGSAVPSSFLPLTAEQKTDDLRIEGALALRAAARELLGGRELVTLYAGNGRDPLLLTGLVAVDDDGLVIDGSGPQERRAELLAAPFITLVGASRGVKIQLQLGRPKLQRDAQGQELLVFELPPFGWRLQRRGAFRVRPPGTDQARVVVRLKPKQEVIAVMRDLSVGGLSLFWPLDSAKAPAVPLPELGSVLQQCRIDAAVIASIPCDLRLIRVQSPSGDGNGPPFVSCGFHRMPDDVTRLIQMYVMDIERRSRGR